MSFSNRRTRGGATRLALALALLCMIAACRGRGEDAGAVPDDGMAQVRPLPAGGVHCGPAGTALSVRVCGNQLVDASGTPLQLRGANVSGLEAVAVFGWSPANPWGAQTGDATPQWNTIKSWGVNAVRIPLNEASWNGRECVDEGGVGVVVADGGKRPNAPGTRVSADPGGNYRATVVRTVEEATAAGLYVILDLHLTAPGPSCPTAQNAMADEDHALEFWSTVAARFRTMPSVMFELFNEPFLEQSSLSGADPWQALVEGGGAMASFAVQGKRTVVTRPWRSAGLQPMLDAVRKAGAGNVVLASSLTYSQAVDGWLAHHPVDRVQPAQLVAVWHAYPGIGYPSQASCLGLPDCSARVVRGVREILEAGYPVLITEFGDVLGTDPPRWASRLLPYADVLGVGYFAWTWDVWPDQKMNVLITDAAGTPTPGYGAYVRRHYLCRASGAANCP